MKRVVLIGLPGSGKTTVGRTLAERTGRLFLDTDALIVSAAGEDIPTIFASRGEAVFRALERNAVRTACAVDGAVISTGGGAVLSPDNVALLRAGGTVFFLDRSVESILRTADLTGRPLLRGGAECLRTLAAQRDALYRAAAHSIVPDGGIEESVSYILAHIAE